MFFHNQELVQFRNWIALLPCSRTGYWPGLELAAPLENWTSTLGFRRSNKKRFLLLKPDSQFANGSTVSGQGSQMGWNIHMYSCIYEISGPSTCMHETAVVKP